jgi:L-2-hydroxyglutarate oxidase
LIDPQRLRQVEPHVVGIEALLVHDTGIVDYLQVCRRLKEIIVEYGNEVLTGAAVSGIEESENEVVVRTPEREIRTNFVVACAGLHADRVAAMAGAKLSVRIVPFRGEYYELTPEAKHLCRNLIYPVADPRFPFLGVHFTRTIDGSVECGPNAVFAFAREGYRLGIVNARDMLESLTYVGFLRLVGRYWRTGLGEMWRSLSKQAFTRGLQRLIPEIRAEDLIEAPAGVRAQAITRDGRLLYDFAFHETPRTVHVINSPSPAATASLSIGKQIVERLSERAALGRRQNA